MTADHASTSSPRRRAATRIVVLLLLAAVAIASAFALTLSQDSRPGQAQVTALPSSPRGAAATTAAAAPPPAGTAVASESAAATPTGAPAGTTTVVPPAAIDNPQIAPPVKSAVAGFITKAGQISTDPIPAPSPGAPEPTPAAVDFTAVAYGVALGELEAQNQEFTSNGWQQSGTVVVVGTSTTTPLGDSGDEKIAVSVCLDSSAVQIVDNTGAAVLKAEKPGTRKNLNTYVVQNVSGAWLVVDHTFPDDPHC